jgi:hypothetical protein
VPTRLCLELRCPEPAIRRGRCAKHNTVCNRETRSENRGIYNSKRWQITRSRYLFDHPLCEHPECMAIATDVHHKVDLQAGGDPWAMDGLEALCHSHHSMETRARQATR